MYDVGYDIINIRENLSENSNVIDKPRTQRLG